MGLPNVKVTMFFVSGTVGWDESHLYIPIVALTDPGLVTAATALVTARVKCLDGVAAKLVDCRMSIDNINRDTVHLARGAIPVPDPAVGYQKFGGPSTGGTTWLYQTPQVAWPILLDTQDPVVDAIIYITGLPANTNQTGPGPYDLMAGTGVTTFLTGYGAYLSTGSIWGASSGRHWPSATVTPANSLALAAPPIWTAAGAGLPATFKVTVTPAIVPAASIGGYIRIGGLKWQNRYSRRRFNHSYQVLNIAGQVLTLNAGDTPYDPGFITNGYIQVATQVVQPYSAYTLRNITHKKRGRPTYSPRGRRAA